MVSPEIFLRDVLLSYAYVKLLKGHSNSECLGKVWGGERHERGDSDENRVVGDRNKEISGKFII